MLMTSKPLHSHVWICWASGLDAHVMGSFTATWQLRAARRERGEDHGVMTDSEDNAEERGPGQRPGAAAAAPGVAETEARRALDAYPTLVTVGVVFTCMEQAGRRWRIIATGQNTPQQARDELAHHFLEAVSNADEAAREEFRAAAEVLDRERHDELTVADRRFRIGRIEKIARVGSDGPEPPRSCDPETPPDNGQARAHRSLGFLDAIAMSGTAAAVTRYELHTKVPETSTTAEHHYACRALDTHSRLVLLPAQFTPAEEIDGHWRPHTPGTQASPQAARDSLADYFRTIVPGPDSPDPVLARAARALGHHSPGPAVCAEYATAADTLDREHGNDIHVAGRHFRITRIEHIVRLSMDGPEPPRPCDHDPYPPPASH